MGRRFEADGEFFRVRRGKTVKIPAEWVDKVPHEQTIRKRASKSREARKAPRNLLHDGSYDWSNWRERRYDGEHD